MVRRPFGAAGGDEDNRRVTLVAACAVGVPRRSRRKLGLHNEEIPDSNERARRGSAVGDCVLLCVHHLNHADPNPCGDRRGEIPNDLTDPAGQ